MTKLLKPYTIIPSNLYVHRAADRQVRHIISDMGRPGYVLVARQMGKTNLLINAKRELETDNDVFVYIDLSNTFETARECFENIINTAIETNEDRFKNVSDTLFKNRLVERNLPAHKQHVNELRRLLKAITGKLIIILDEIDVLTRTHYSDQLFSQIRSIYFSRINYKELARLTYLLSGVVEPTEIIKDPKISPFNIGQKIFLNDFTQDEFLLFLDKAGLSHLNDPIKERIYFWTGGNPRMTWDVCSEVENVRKNGEVDLRDIDKVVRELYLITFDKPPIDTIRELTKNDRELRNAVIEIELKKSKEVSDKLRRKLYLSGIINFEENDVRIKNNIIRESLNVAWLRSVEEEERGLVRIAHDFFEKEKYDQSLVTYQRYLQNDAFSEEQKTVCYYQMGYASFVGSDFRKALEYFDKADVSKEDYGQLFLRVCNLRGTAHFYLNEFELSMNNFRTVIEHGRKDELYVRALINFGSASVKSTDGKDKEEAVRIFEDIVNESGLDKSKIDAPVLQEMKSIAYYNLSHLVENDEGNKAKEYIKVAIQFAKITTKPLMLLNLFLNEKAIQEKISLLRSVVDLIIDNDLQPIQPNPENPLDFTYDQLNEVLAYSYLYDKDVAFKKFYSCERFAKDVLRIPALLFATAMSAAVKNKTADTIEILRKLRILIVEGNYETDPLLSYQTLKYLAYFVDNRQERNVVLDYLSWFAQNRLQKVDYMDFEIIANFLYSLIEQKDFEKALEVIYTIESVKSEVDKSFLINYIVIYFLELKILILMKKLVQAREKAQIVLDLCSNDELRLFKSNLLGDTGIETIKDVVENFLNPKKQIPITVPKAFGRNERIKVKYRDGHVVETKYKKVEGDIKTGKCEVMA